MNKYYDVIIIGTGIAGLFTALNIDKRLSVLLVSKSSSENGNSALAQGGIVSCRNPKVHFSDTLKAGSFYNNKKAVKIIEKYSNRNIEKLINYGVDFDKDEYGNLKFTREGGHSENTILYSKDSTGMEIIKTLNREVKKRDNIYLVEDTLVIELLKKEEATKGVVVLNNEKMEVYSSDAVVVATGGVGRIYKNTTNSEEITGDGIALAYEIGAKVIDMEFIQFHPTAMYGDDYEKRFLISEAVRGEGAVLRNVNGEAFMKKYHDMKDLAPRDVVARSIFEEIKETESEFVYLDITHKDSEYVKGRFPNIYDHCLSSGIDITNQYIRISPAEHYIMGGIETDLNGKTNIDGLFACGECACTGVHGANRLASNSLLEGIVFGERVAKCVSLRILKLKSDFNVNLNEKNHNSIVENTSENILGNFNEYNSNYEYENRLLNIEKTLRETMSQYASIVRNKTDLLYALDKMDELEKMLRDQSHINKKYFEIKNMIIVSKLIIDAAIKRRKSIGSHFILSDDRSEIS